MERQSESNRFSGWARGLFVIVVALFLFGCEQQAGQSSLANKPPPNVGAIAEVDGSDDTKKEGQKPKAGAEQAPTQAPAAGQPAQAAPKQ